MNTDRRIPAWQTWGAGAALVVLIFVVYRPVFTNAWIWDDDAYISKNTTLRTADGLRRIWLHPTDSPQYYPLTFTSFWIEAHIFGLAPENFHRDNVILHTASALLLWLILRRLNIPAAWLITALWAIHPVNVESVAWASERKNVQSGFFYLLAMLAYWPFIHPPQNSRDVPVAEPPNPFSALTKSAHPWHYISSLFLFLCALLSKTVASTFPGAVLLLIWWKRRKITRRDVLLIIPFILIALPLSWLTSHIEHTFVGARGPEFDFHWWQRCAIAAHAAWFYACKDIFPVNLSFIYPRWILNSSQIIYIPALLAALGILIWLAQKRGRGVIVGPLFFLGTLFPALGFVNVYPMRFSFVADHFQYLASIGIIAAVIATIARSGRWVHWPIGRIAASATLATFALLAYTRCLIFADSVTLWSDAQAKNPDSWMVHTNLGASLMDRAEAEMNHRQMLLAARDFSAAQLQLEQAHEIRSNIVEPLTNLARIEELQLHYLAAERWLRQALDINPNSADVHFHLGAVLVKEGKIDAAIAEYARAILLDKRHVPAWGSLGIALDLQGKTQPAIDAYHQALSIDQDDVIARVHLGYDLLKSGKRQEAADQFQRALAIDPGLKDALDGLRAARGN